MPTPRKKTALTRTAISGPPLRCAVYARYSDDGQSAASIDDQVRLCRTHAERQGSEVVEVHSDAAITGAIRQRPGYRALIEGMRAGASGSCWRSRSTASPATRSTLPPSTSRPCSTTWPC